MRPMIGPTRPNQSISSSASTPQAKATKRKQRASGALGPSRAAWRKAIQAAVR